MSNEKTWSTGQIAREHGVMWDAIFCDGDLVALVNFPEVLPVLAAATDLLAELERVAHSLERCVCAQISGAVEELAQVHVAIAKARGKR